MRAIDIISDALERLNRLSPGEALNADDAERGLRRLNLLVDELSAKRQFLYRSALTSAAQTGHITLGSGPWAAIPPGAEIIGATVDAQAMAPLTVQQFAGLTVATGMPGYFAPDGMATVYLWPTPAGQAVTLQTQHGVSAFADLTTDYTAPPGWASALGAALAVRIAPMVLGRLPPELLRAERQCMLAVDSYEPAIVDADGYVDDELAWPARMF